MDNEEEILKGYTMERVIKFLERRFKEAEANKAAIGEQRKEYQVSSQDRNLQPVGFHVFLLR